jgi:cytochrome b561
MWLIALLIGMPMLLYGCVVSIAGNSQDHRTAVIGITCGLLLLVLAIADLVQSFYKGDPDNPDRRRD